MLFSSSLKGKDQAVGVQNTVLGDFAFEPDEKHTETGQAHLQYGLYNIIL